MLLVTFFFVFYGNYKLDNNKQKSLDDPISCTSVSPSPQTAFFYDSKTEKMDRK